MAATSSIAIAVISGLVAVLASSTLLLDVLQAAEELLFIKFTVTSQRILTILSVFAIGVTIFWIIRQNFGTIEKSITSYISLMGGVNRPNLPSSDAKERAKLGSKKGTFEIESQFGNLQKDIEKLEFVDRVLDEIVKSLSTERGTITTRTFTNLVFGAAIALFGAYWLIDIVASIKFEPGDENWQLQVFSFAARLSVVIMIQVFAYFFLNLYRSGLQEIKYYRNEMTNALSKQAGIRAALVSKEKAAISHAIKRLMDTERNFILKKGESTMFLDHERIERETDNQLAEIIASSVKTGIRRMKSVEKGAATRGRKKANP